MALGTATTCDLYDQFPEFAMPLQPVRAEGCAIANQALLDVYLP
jgi:hypothetical protein